MTVGLTQAPGMGEEAAGFDAWPWESHSKRIQHLCERRLGQRLVHLAIASNGTIDEGGRILVAQLTTDGDISGQFRAQLFPGGDQ